MKLEALAACLGILAGVSEVGAQTASFTKAIDNWSEANGVAVTAEVRGQLASRTARAVETVQQRQPFISAARLEQLAPEAAVSYLDISQKDAAAPTVAALLELLALGRKDAGTIAGTNEYPILYVDIAPPEPSDFVVAINGTAYRAGLRVFRVTEGEKAIHVTRAVRPPCDKSVRVTKVGPNRVQCAM